MDGDVSGRKSKKVAYILGNYPGKIETFVLSEMKALKRMGFDIYVCPLNHIPLNGQVKGEFNAIYAEPFNLSGIALSHLYFMLFKTVPYLKCLLRHRSYGGKRVFLKSTYFALAIKKLGIRHIHAHFGWTAADSARMICRLTDIPFSFTAHAADIYYLPDNLEAKLREAKFVMTCVRNNKAYISRAFGQTAGRKTEVVYHGVDMETFRPLRDAGGKVVDVLSIGNLVEKKGHRYLIEACGILKRKGVSLKCLIVGEGPEKERLVNIIKDMEIEDSVIIEGRRPQAELPVLYAKSKVFVLPSIITGDGDTDGIPNVLAEAMAMGLPVVSCDVPNISELIEHGKDGILVRERDAEALAGSIENLLLNEGMRENLGKNAREKIEKAFDAKEHIQKVASMLFGR